MVKLVTVITLTIIFISLLQTSTISVVITLYKEAVAQRYSIEEVLLEILENWQENTCARVSFLIKLQAQAPLVAVSVYKWSVFLVFRREAISYDPYITIHDTTRWYHFSHSFSYSVMDPPGALFVASIAVRSKNFWRR